MSEQTPPSTESNPEPKTIIVTEPSSTQNVPLNRQYIVIGCAIGLCICFFLPWVHIIFFTPSGLDLSREGGKGIFLWSLPAFALIACLAGATGRNYKIAGQLAGIVPFAFLFYG